MQLLKMSKDSVNKYSPNCYRRMLTKSYLKVSTKLLKTKEQIMFI